MKTLTPQENEEIEKSFGYLTAENIEKGSVTPLNIIDLIKQSAATIKNNAVEKEREHLKQANELLRSAYHIATSECKKTNWKAFIKKLKKV